MTTFQQLMDNHAIVALECQLALADLIHGLDWEADTQEGWIRFGDHRWTMEVLGTESYDSSSWLWASANLDAGLPTEVVKTANKLRALGEAEGVSVLASAKSPIAEIDGDQAGVLGVGIGGARAYFRVPQGSGTTFLLITDPACETLARPSAVRTARAIDDATRQFELTHADAINAYCAARSLATVGDSSEQHIKVAGGTVVVRLDVRGRIQEVHAQA